VPTDLPRYAIADLHDDLAAAGFVAAFAAFDINNAGRVSGGAFVEGGYQHGFFWERGRATDVGTLGGAQVNSQAGGHGGRDELSIVSEIGVLDPLNEDFCGLGSPLICSAAVWRRGVITPLPTLGGNNAAAITVNGQGQIVGLAEDGVVDNTCMAPQRSHFHAVAWENGVVRKLPPLLGDEVGMALRNNDKGQVVGTSGLCSNTIFAGFGIGPHAVLWNNGVPRSLGDLGDPNLGVAASINNHGEVVGGASVSDGSLHPFLWTEATGMRDLGLMSADASDAANTPFQINDRGEMVGASCDATLSVCRGYLWRGGAFTDLNDLIPTDSPLYIVLPFSINARGEIAGLAVLKSTGEPRVFIATPASGLGDARSASVPTVASRRVVLRGEAGKIVRQRLRGRSN
jgi:probable HAF family extracellular repeat protein